MKKKQNEYKYLISIIIILLFVNVPYFITFFGSFSKNSNDWSNYSSYVSGLLNPILSLIGLYLLLREYSKSINIRLEDTIIKINDKIEQDLQTIFNRIVYFKAVTTSKKDQIDFINFLRFGNKIEFTEIQIERGSIKFETKLTFEIIQLIDALHLLYINVNKLQKEYIEYYEYKYFFVLNYLFDEGFYANELIKTDKNINENVLTLKALKYLQPIWNDKKIHLTTAST